MQQAWCQDYLTLQEGEAQDDGDVHDDDRPHHEGGAAPDPNLLVFVRALLQQQRAQLRAWQRPRLRPAHRPAVAMVSLV